MPILRRKEDKEFELTPENIRNLALASNLTEKQAAFMVEAIMLAEEENQVIEMAEDWSGE